MSEILKRFPTPGPTAKFKDEKERFIAYMDTQFFSCHVRRITSAYKNKAWVGVYSRGTGLHGMDMLADFYNSTGTPPKDDPGFPKFAQQYQDYLLSHARTGDPNTLANKGMGVMWPKVKWGDVLGDVLEAGKDGFKIGSDSITSAENCDIFMDILAGITKAGGEFFPCLSSHFLLFIRPLFYSFRLIPDFDD
jgi:hypothetical protein